MAELIKKHKIIPFLNKTPSSSATWVQIKKATDWARTLNPVTEERDYIADEHPTTEVTDYKPSSSFTITTYKGEADFDYFKDLYDNLSIGADAQTEFLLVHVFDIAGTVTTGSGSEAVTTTYYKAKKVNCTVVVDEWNVSGSQLTVNVYENGTATAGYVSIAAGVPTFTDTAPEFDAVSNG